MELKLGEFVIHTFFSIQWLFLQSFETLLWSTVLREHQPADILQTIKRRHKPLSYTISTQSTTKHLPWGMRIIGSFWVAVDSPQTMTEVSASRLESWCEAIKFKTCHCFAKQELDESSRQFICPNYFSIINCLLSMFNCKLNQLNLC